MGNYASKLIAIAAAEVGYLEKATNSNLDSKTSNAGRGNFTKYARDLDKITGFYNGKKNGFAWCAVFVQWCFVQAFGVTEAKKMLNHGNCGAGCKFSAQYYRNEKRFYSSPKVGDQIFFGVKGAETHTGIVYKVDSSKVYTIEGNTSGAAGVVANGGGVFKKSYALSYNKIVGYGRPIYDAEQKNATASKATAGGAKTVNITLTQLDKGAQGEQVKTLQRLLKQLGYKGNDGKALSVDGDFGNNTLYAVNAFQKKKKLTVDGSVGAATWGKLLKG